MLTSDPRHAQNQFQNPQTTARPLRGVGLAAVTALPLLAALLAACNPGAAPAGLVAASNSPSVKPSAKPTPGGATSPATSVRPGASGSPGSQSLSSASSSASSGSGSGSSSASPAASASAGAEASASPAATSSAAADQEDVYDTAIHLSEPVEARYVFKQRSDFSSLYPSVRYSSYPYYGGGYGGSYGYGYPMSSPYYPSIFGKIESNTTVKFRFEPKPSRTMLVDLWLENRNYGSINYQTPSPYPTALATSYPSAYPYYDISSLDQSSFAVAQASVAPIAVPSPQPSASASPSYTEHYQVLIRLNGEIKEYIEPGYIAGTDYTAQVYQRQIASLLRPFFSSYSPELVRRGISWPARDNLFTEFDTLAGTSGQLRVTRSPSWSMESGGKTVELSYRSEVKVTTKDGETESIQSFKESAKASIDPATGLLLKMNSTLSIDENDKSPYLLELERL